MNSALSTPPLSILVIDDDDVDREKILRLLDQVPLHLHVAEGNSIKDALSLMGSQSFDCAILDYQLRGALGSELISAIKNHNQTPVPIIMISGNSDERVVANVIRDGVFDYLPKRNLGPDQLQSALHNGLDWAKAEKDLQEQRARFNQLSEGLPQLVWTCQPDGHCDFVNRRWRYFTGVEKEDMLHEEWIDHIHPEDREQFEALWKNLITNGEELAMNLRLRRFDGEYRWFDTRATPQRNAKGDIIRWLGSNTDITEFELTRQALTSSEHRFHAAFENAPLGMALVDTDGTILQANTALQKLLGYDEKNSNKTLWQNKLTLTQLYHPNDVETGRIELEKLQQNDLSSVQYEARCIAVDKREILTLVSVSIIAKTNDLPCYLFHFYDLSERKHHEEQLLKLAHFDSLTGLGNRAKFNEEIEFLIQKSNRTSTSFAVLFGDIDHFKQINDAFGHQTGDQLLKIVAKRLKMCLRKDDRIARLGGDEFVILLQDVKQYEAVATVAEKLIKYIKRPMRLGQLRIHTGMSFGIAIHPTDGDDAQTLLRNADSALYDAKANGRGCYQLYRKELTEYVHRRLMLDSDLRSALTNHEFELYFQPVVNLSSLTITSAEALIRWRHPVRGLVPPDEFIPYAQETELINHIGKWVITEACRRASEWNAQGFTLGVAINVSARQFYQDDLVAQFVQALQKFQLDPSQLIVEITEQMFLENTQRNLDQIVALKAIGIKISLDDFGIGYSSLSYIIRFSPHYLKIDRSFVDKIGAAQEHDEMVNAIIGLSKIIPMEIVGEGVEDIAQLNYLHERGCNLGQGYYFSRPLPFNEFIALLHDLQTGKRQISRGTQT